MLWAHHHDDHQQYRGKLCVCALLRRYLARHFKGAFATPYVCSLLLPRYVQPGRSRRASESELVKLCRTKYCHACTFFPLARRRPRQFSGCRIPTYYERGYLNFHRSQSVCRALFHAYSFSRYATGFALPIGFAYSWRGMTRTGCWPRKYA